MAFGGLILTNKGREALTRAQLGEALEFAGVAVGNGSYAGSYNDITSLAHELAVLDILRAEADGDACVLEAELSNAGITAGYYLREIGILAKNGADTVLYAYTNAGTDAEYIPASNGAVGVEKRLRFSLITEGVSNIIFEPGSVLYLAQQDFEEAMEAVSDRIDNMILYGPADTYIPPGSTLFVVDDDKNENLSVFQAAVFSNVEIRASPDGSQGLIGNEGASGSAAVDSSGTISGKITVAGEPEPDTVFLHK